MVEAQPATGSEYNKFFNTINIIRIKAINEMIIPKNVEIDNGTVVNAMIPSSEYETNPKKDQLVSPDFLSMFSYSIHFVS